MSACTTAGSCPLCRRGNSCRMVSIHSYKGPCWCEQAEIPTELLEQLPDAGPGRACICPACVGDFNRKRAYQPTPGAGDHYYDPSGQWVFTERYHRRRGYCCGSGCRHCPYEPAATRDAT